MIYENYSSDVRLNFLIDNLSIILFAIFLIGGYLFARLVKKRALNVDDLLGLVWESVAFSLTFTYVIGTFDYVFFESSYFGFNKNDVAVMAIPGVICLTILATSVWYRFISKQKKPSHRGKK